ncbi:MAG: DUF4442 domain-containing protein, partial [Pseudomonadota bacterium]
LRRVMNWWPPLLAAGIRVREIAPDFSRVRVDLVSLRLNRNYVGTHFGGSLFAMTDPFYMIMYLNRLGSDYLVWDYSASIRFVKPGRGTVSAQFELTEADTARVIHETRDGQRHLYEHLIEVKDRDGEVVARVDRTLYFRRKDHRNRSSAA